MKMRLIEKRYLAPTVLLVQFEAQEALSFRAGQHIVFDIPHDNTVLQRAFSIASAPDECTIECIVKIVPNGVASRYFETILAGDLIDSSPPRGTFRFDSHGHPAVFIASGTGISPLRSMILDLLKKQGAVFPISLYIENDEAELISEFEKLGDTHPHFTLKRSAVAHIGEREAHYYICGGPNFVANTEHALLENGVLPSAIHYETY